MFKMTRMTMIAAISTS